MKKIILMLMLLAKFSYAEEHIIDVITKLNDENQGLEINIDEILNTPSISNETESTDAKIQNITEPVVPSTNPVPTKAPKIALPEVDVSTPKLPASAIEPVITKDLLPNVDKPVSSPVPSVPPVHDKSDQTTLKPAINPIAPTIKKPTIPVPSKPKPDKDLEDISDIIVPNANERPVVQPKPKNIEIKKSLIDSAKPQNEKIEFEGLLQPQKEPTKNKVTRNPEPSFKAGNQKNKQNKKEKVSYQVQLKPEELWKNSVVFTRDEQEQMFIALSNFLNYMPKSQKSKNSTQVIKKNRSNYTIALRSIMFLSSDNWTIWINDKRISSKDKNIEVMPYKIIAVQPKKVKIELVLNDEMEVPDMLNLHHDDSFLSVPVEYNMGDKVVRFEIAPNQIFNSKTMTINEM